MTNSLRISASAAVLCSAISMAGPALAQDEVQLLPPEVMEATSEEMTPEGEFKTEPPWKIGMSFVGVGNTYIIQMIEETKRAAASNPDIGEFIFTEANWQPAKQVADLEDLIAQDIDALIVAPLSPALVKEQVAKARAAGIPVVNYGTGGEVLKSTVEIMGGGRKFGAVGGEFLREKLDGEGVIWAFRGPAGVEEEQQRYDGFRNAIEGSDITIGAEVHGDWNYAKGKQLCENLVLSGQPVDGIWFSGADMTRACIDVFTEFGKELVPMTGESNNGFLRIWKEAGIDGAAPIFTPGLGPATVRAAVALLEGKSLHTHYYSAPDPITNENIDDYYRPDFNDSYWVTSTLPEDVLEEMFKK